MNKMTGGAEHKPSDEQYRGAYHLPEFIPAENCVIVDIMEAEDGQPWVFLDPGNKWGAEISSVKIIPEGKVIKLALRGNLVGLEPLPVAPDEVAAELGDAWLARRGLAKPADWAARGYGYNAIKLPFWPDEVIVVDQVL